MPLSDPAKRRRDATAGAGHTARGLRVRLLGQFGAEVDGVPLRLRGDKRRAMLASLLLNSGRTVTTAHLIERVWGTPPSPAARSALQVHVARVRALLDHHCGTPLITGGDGGYRVDLTEEQSDLLRFRSLVRRAADAASRGDTGARAELFVRALELWRGPVLADVVSPVLHERDVAPLNEELLRAAEEGFGAALAHGEHERVADRIGPIATAHPEREPLIRVQMVALYRSGRSSDALRVYARTRDILAERLGADPGRELQETFHGILRGDLDPDRARVPRQRTPAEVRGANASVWGAGASAFVPDAFAGEGREATPVPGTSTPDTPAPGTGTEEGGQRRSGEADAPLPAPRASGRVHAPVRTPAALSPAELPAAPAALVGREEAVAELDRLVDPRGAAPGGVLVRGPAGAGASALALSWAHAAAPHFPDGQLYVDLRGGDGTPRAPAEVLRRLVRSLASGARDAPTMDVEEAAARTRTLLAHRRVLLVLDNASSSRQVRPLLPGGTGCAAVVTSRYWLTELLVRDGLRAVPVGPLTPDAAVELLRAHAGPGRCTEPVLRRLARQAGFLPLPLRMAAVWLDTHPHRSAAELVRLLEGVDPARGVTPTARMAAVLRAGPEEGRHGRGEVPAGSHPPETSVGQGSYVRLSPG
ncbi:SARP family transcriptional regulator [Nocardiopsis sp. TSRI0078]|uniref:AfsR/SARP family transcriptional regulator n=1 Tax=unclassified Nocardiopsis TaxID=2649073 RepID=UPI00093F81FD|nr:AfsR/SARP family transcriptional regulator [Nocardiopsis sp. TSRI0078]OKI19071.1 SARP family transcriptional regulator [Nocardiopsis sp. TSRI0078]